MEDLIDFTPALHAEAVERVSHYKLGPIFTPPVLSKASGPIGTLALATSQGGTNWPGGSYDPETHIFYVFSQRALSTLALVPPEPGMSDMNFIQGTATEGPRRTGGSGADQGADAGPNAPATGTGPEKA